MATIYYADAEGAFLGGFCDSLVPPIGAIFVTTAPDDAHKVWVDGQGWVCTKTQLKAALAECRYNKEVGGIVLEGLPIPTDDRAKTLIAGKYSKVIAESPPDATFTIKVAGQFMTITYADLVAIFNAVNAHVQKCFDSEAVVYTAIEAGEVLTYEQVATAFNTAYEG